MNGEETVRGESKPNFSPDGKKVAFSAFVARLSGIVIRDLQTGRERELPADLEESDSPTWSPDGKQIAFVGWAKGRSSCHIFVSDSDGKGRRQLTEGDYFNWNPVWSPDGRRIAWEQTTETDKNREIYVMNVDGTNKRNLTQTPDVDGCD